MGPTEPTYRLRDIKVAFSDGRYLVTKAAMDGAAWLGFFERDIRDCVAVLKRTHFDKTMPSNSVPALFQDVYRVSYSGRRLYVKLQLSEPNRAVVISFKEA
jgi:hypothetical protein